MKLTDLQLADLVTQYKRCRLPELQAHLKWYSEAPSLECAIHRASGAEADESREMHPHQSFRPIRWFVSKEEFRRKAWRELNSCKSEIGASTNFEDLYRLIEKTLSPIKGFGDLMVYDTALRLGAFKGIKPNSVYLQAGALDGAKSFFSDAVLKPNLKTGRSIEPSNFQGLGDLDSTSIENFLCIANPWLSGKKPYYPDCLYKGAARS